MKNTDFSHGKFVLTPGFAGIGNMEVIMKRFPAVFIIAAACIWGSMGIFVRRIEVIGFSPMDIVAIRSIGAFLILLLYTFFFRRRLLLICRKDLALFAASGILSITFFNYCYFTTITRTSLSLAAVLLYTAPSFVILLAHVFFKERITPRKILTLLMSFAGCVFVSGILKNSLKLGAADFMLGIGAGFGYALYSIFTRAALSRGYSSLTITLYTFFFAGLSSLPFADFARTIRLIRLNCRIWPDLASMVLLVTIAAYALYTFGLHSMEAGTASILACIEPVVATGFGFLLYRERLTPMEAIGIVLVLTSSVVVNLSPKSKMNKKEAKDLC